MNKKNLTMKKQILLLISFVLVTFCSYGQTWNQYKKDAKKAFEKQDYFTALYYLDTMQKIDSAKFNLFFLQAETARHFNAFKFSEDNYRKVLQTEASADYAKSTLGLALVLKMQGKYTEAIQVFNDYLVINPDSTSQEHLEVKSEIQACKWAIELTKIYDKDLVIQHLNSAVNTTFSDFSPYPFEDKLLFSSLKFIPQEKKKKSSKKYSKILELNPNGTIEPFDLGLTNEEAHTAHIAFNKARNQLFFSVCEYVDGSKIQCKIYTRKKIDAVNWGPSQILSEDVNQEGVTSTQPALGYDEKSDKEILFFVSDRKGGIGGIDLWMTYLDSDGKTGNPINIKALNTVKDEQSPFFHNYTQTLYFSSNGRISLGGHDIYKSAIKGNGWEKVSHTGFPLNSSYNDVDFTLNHIGSEGYFASNREGTQFLDEKISACCYDIFKAEFNSYLLDLNVLTYLKRDSSVEELTDVTVAVYEIFEDAEQEKFYKIEPEGNNHFFSINSNKKYRVIAKKENFFPHEFEFNTAGPIEGDLLIKEAYLQPLKLNVLTFTDEPPQAANDVKVNLFIINQDSSETEISLLLDTVGNSHFFPLLANQNYKIVGQKEGYDNKEVRFNTNTWESETNILIKEIILPLTAEDRIIPVSDPFALYFDNNLPFPNNTDTTTDANLSELIAIYKEREVEFQQEFSKGSTGAKKSKKIAQVAYFFKHQLDSNYIKFLDFTNSTLRRLRFGRDITITVKAYASPLASEAYNFALTKRRISSIRNFYRTYRDGAMEKYVDEGRVKFNLVPFGEKEAPKEVSDNPYDKINSVFSPVASEQRKVVIIGAESKKRKQKVSVNSQ